ncbi:MAG: hypothetical protein IJA26_07870, partial [Clostridia bacterium]|nr:hypothetical protein [Clostridia bacterium]
MKRRLMRPSAAFFPFVLLISALFGDELTTLIFLLLWYALQITTLCAPVAFCNAAAREPGVRRVGRRFFGGIMQCILGGALLFVPIGMLSSSAALSGGLITLAAGAFLIIIEQMFEERMFALGRKVDGTLLSLICNGLLLLGLMLDAGSGINAPEIYSRMLGRSVELRNFYLLCGCSAAVIVSIAITLLIARGKGFTPLPVNCGHGPKAMLQVLLYPAAVFIAVRALDTSINLRHLLVGMILWQLSRTVCRRTRPESRPLDWLLTAITAVFAVLACLHPAFLPYAI